MSKAKKKMVRENFRKDVFGRDGNCCVLCLLEHKVNTGPLDAHHITSRDDMPAGGYVKSNGISVCYPHHEEVEAGLPSPEELYVLIKSSYEDALSDSKRLERKLENS